jgi:hypothetical protein
MLIECFLASSIASQTTLNDIRFFVNHAFYRVCIVNLISFLVAYYVAIYWFFFSAFAIFSIVFIKKKKNCQHFFIGIALA